MKNSFRACALAGAFLLCAVWSYAQQNDGNYDPKRFRKEPVWIQMMDDPNANFYQTIEAFREFWRGYELPGEPIELEGKDSFEREIGLEEEKEGERGRDRDKEREREREKEKRRSPDGRDYSYEVKRFKGWYENSKSWVLPDGHIMTQEERQQLIDRQQQELREIEKNQKN